MSEKELSGKQRRFSKLEIAVRHMQYIGFILTKQKIYDRRQSVFLEYNRCLQKRGIKKSGKTDYLIRKELKKNRLVFSRIAVSVTNQCSLRCRDCNNLMPYCKEKFMVDVGEQIQDLKKIFDYVDGIINVEVIGGEPFVYKDLSVLLQYLCAEPRVKFVDITSNGTVLPLPEVQEILKHPKICVRLSDYGKINSEKIQRIYRELEQNQICVQNLNNRKWILPGDVSRRQKSKIRMKYEYFNCDARIDCRTLYKGKLYVCGRAPVLDELGLLTDGSSFLDIRKMDADRRMGRKQLYNFFVNDYAESCAYCDCSSDSSCWIESGIQV